MNFVLSSLSEGLLWSIMAIGVYLTFRILNIADMTAEGAFPLGGQQSLYHRYRQGQILGLRLYLLCWQVW